MKVVVLAGGISTERDVSLISGKMIYQAMKRLGHQAVLLDVFLGMERDDIDHIFESDEDFSAGIEAIHEINPDISAVKALRKDGGKCYFGPNVIKICQMADVVFLGLHGADGEGGKVQAAFDLLGIRYTGTDFVSGALAMDKCLAKELFMQNGIPTPAGFRLKKGQEPGEGQQPKFPCVVKVSSGGSSIGVSIVQKEEDYQAALDAAFLYGDEVVVEEYIKGRGNYMDAGIASTILFVYPVLVAIIMAVVFKEKVSPVTMFSIALAFVGISLLCKSPGGQTLSLVGITFVFLSSLSYAIYIVGVNRSSLKDMPIAKLTFYVLLFGLSVYVVRLKFCTGLQPIPTPLLWVNAVSLAVFPTVISLVTMTKAIHYIGSTPTAILGALEPVTALFFGVLIFGEQLTPRIILGILMVITAVTLIIGGKTLLKKSKIRLRHTGR